MSDATMSDDHAYADDAPLTHASEHMSADVISLDSMRSAIVTNMSTNFEQDDLDVPAFLRKRNDVM